ncbi:MAG: hypothetical protein Q7U56_13670, partial [Humidesulfovibrio sp.]|nr:hypothetical protein [Humidesulfovibrio sp.]
MASYLCWQQIANQGPTQMDNGSIAQWVSAIITLLAIAFALFKESILCWYYKPNLELTIKASP